MSVYAKPYFGKKDYVYHVKYTNTEGLESIELHSVSNRKSGILDTIKWVYKEHKVTYYEPKYCFQNANFVHLSSPSRGVFEDTEYIPNPQVKFPLIIGDSIYVEQPMSNGNTMKGYLIVTDTLNHGKNTNNNDVWKIEAYNLEDPKYSAIYKYNERNGFVFLKFKLNEVEIEMNLSLTSGHGFADEK